MINTRYKIGYNQARIQKDISVIAHYGLLAIIAIEYVMLINQLMRGL